MRYKYTEIQNDKVSKKKVLTTTLYPEIESKDSDVIYYAKFDDSFMNLAYRFYGDQSLWWIIARANDFKGRTKFTVGQKLIIPIDIGDVVKQHNKLNSNV
tara:strand:+ start:6534 stop:6833 length:300 start_codon:yes stop_codon:yes gene_type:complete